MQNRYGRGIAIDLGFTYNKRKKRNTEENAQ